jgi:hypothetical protein
MKIYRFCKNATSHNDLSIGLIGKLSLVEGMLPLPAILIKNRNSSLLSPGKIFTNSMNNHLDKSTMLYAYKGWEELCDLYTLEEIEWAYSNGWRIYEIFIKPLSVGTSSLDNYQCVFDKTHITQCREMSLDKVYREYVENDKCMNYVQVNILDNIFDDSIGIIKALCYLNEEFILSFRDEYSYKDSSIDKYRKLYADVKRDSKEWNKLRKLSESGIIEDAITIIKSMYILNK